MRSTSFEAYRSPLRPSGTGAFVPPSPPYPGKRYATGFSAIPPQAADPLTRTLGLASDLPCDEDCLYLHVYSVGVEATSVGVEATSVGVEAASVGVEATGPGRAALRPVLVWLHGGAFLSGTGNVPLYDGSRLAERGDVVVVTLNYRVGALGFLYVDALSGGSGGATANDLFYAIQTDIALRRPATELAEAHARIQPNTYMYLFTWASPFQNGELEACHALDLPFAFGTLDAPGIAAFAGSGSAARRLSENMMEAWLSFACCGDPAHPGIGPWPRYDAKRRATMLFGEMSGAEDAPLESERAVWDLVR